MTASLAALPIAAAATTKGSLAFYGTSFAIGGTGGGVFEFSKNEMFGIDHTPGGYVSSVLFGGVGATGFQFSKSAILDGAIYGGISDFSGQIVDRIAIGSKIDPLKTTLSTLTGGIIGRLGMPIWAGRNAGRGNDISVYKGLETKLARGVITQYNPVYAAKAGMAIALPGLPASAAASTTTGAYDAYNKKN